MLDRIREQLGFSLEQAQHWACCWLGSGVLLGKSTTCIPYPKVRGALSQLISHLSQSDDCLTALKAMGRALPKRLKSLERRWDTSALIHSMKPLKLGITKRIDGVVLFIDSAQDRKNWLKRLNQQTWLKFDCIYGISTQIMAPHKQIIEAQGASVPSKIAHLAGHFSGKRWVIISAAKHVHSRMAQLNPWLDSGMHWVITTPDDFARCQARSGMLAMAKTLQLLHPPSNKITLSSSRLLGQRPCV